MTKTTTKIINDSVVSLIQAMVKLCVICCVLFIAPISKANTLPPCTLVLGTPTSTPVNCFNQTSPNGTAAVTISTGSGSYSYLWNDGQTAQTANGLSAATYTVTVTDNTDLCSATTTVVVTQPGPVINYVINGSNGTSTTPESCPGAADGTATANATGGNGGYTYSWTPSGQTTKTATGLSAAGSPYFVSVRDSKGCTGVNRLATIVTSTPITIVMSNTNVSCNGGATGSATATPSNGTLPHTYAWSGTTQTGATATGLTQGTYTVTVTDNNGCSKTATTTITEPTLLTASVANTSVLCNGGSTGTATVTPGGGTGTKTYLWSFGNQSTTTAVGLTQGTYTVTVTDANNCTVTTTTTITEPTPVTASATNTSVLCNGGNTGTATVTPGGGTGTKTILWIAGGQTGTTAIGLTQGTYTVTVTDANNCTVTTTTTITEPTPLTAGITNTPVLCNGGSTGTATVTPGGGTGTKTVLWSAAGQTTLIATGLTQGTYTVTVTDGNNCTRTATTTVTEPLVITINNTPTNLTCFNYGNGQIVSAPTGGAGGFQYNWMPGGLTGATANNLAAGTYSLTVTDANNCTRTATTTLTEPASPIVSVSSKPVQCNQADDTYNQNGKTWVTPRNTNNPYQYYWLGPPPIVGANDTLPNLDPGNYTVTVTDNQGCKQSTAVTVTQPPALSATITPTNVGCNSLGSITIAASGGNSTTYSYIWNNSQTSSTISNLTPGNYQVTIIDSKGCEISRNANVNAPQPIILQNPNSSNVINETCKKTNGSIKFTAADVSGGTAPYSYSWSNGGTTNQITNLSEGTYTVTVYDSQGCTSSRTITISNQDQPPSANTSIISQITCFGSANGSTKVTASAGTAPYVYSWTPNGGTGVTASNLNPGTYTVIVTDSKGCTATSTSIIIEPTEIIINPLSSNATCGVNNGSASISPTGGTLPYNYIWTNGETTSSITGLGVGSYSVTITDIAGCTKTAGFNIITSNPIALTVSNTNINCFGANTGTATATPLSGGNGSYNYSWSPGGYSISNPTGMSNGTYTVTISDASNPACFGTSTVTITQPTSALGLSLSSPNVTCFGNTNGQVNSTPSGGTSPYTYSWNTTSTASGLTGLGVGTYTLTVTDNKGCTTTSSATVTENPEIIVSSITPTDITCNGANNGSITVSANGGSSALNYSWSPSGGVSSTASGLGPNTYTVTIRDASNCSKTATASINQPAILSITSITPTNATCGSSNGEATANVTGGNTPYIYAWTGGSTAQTATGLGVGTYFVTVNDAKGCAATQSVNITISNQLAIPTPTKTNVTCNGNDDGTILINPTGGNIPGSYNYIWSPGGNTTNNPTGLSPATYTVTVTDAGNAACSSTATVIITQPAVLATNPSSTNITCNGSSNGIASVAPTGGNVPYTYQWSNLATTATINGLPPATYTVTVSDNKGCTQTATIPITQGSALTITPGATTDVSCSGGSNGSSSVSITGGTGTYTYSWSPVGGTAAAASGLPANTYTVSVRDGNNCNSTITIAITQPTPLTITPSSTNANCGLSNGDATAGPLGGTPNYNYSWSNTTTNPTATGLAPGGYTVTVTDANNCSVTQNYNIVVADPLVLQSNKSDVSCNGGSNGMTTVSVTSGGTGTFNYAWLPGGAVSQTVNGLSAGTYVVTITDAINNACTATASVVVNQPNPISPNITPTPISCFGTNDGTVTSAPTGGTPGYSFIYSPGGYTTQTATGLAPGPYTVQVTDNNGCTATAVATVIEPTLLTITQTQTNITCTGALDGTININPNGGTPVYTYAWAPSGSGSSLGSLGPGTYTVTVRDASGCIASSTIVITEPPAMSTNIVGVNPTCYVNNGSAFAEVTGGGVGPFTYVWAPGGATSQTITNRAPGTYSVTINDLGTTTGCPTTLTVTLDFPQITLAFGSQNVLCAGDANGKLWVTPNGGTSPYNYSWNTTATTDTIRSLVQGTYTVTVFDNGGCSATATQTITQPVALGIQATPTNVSCYGENTGAASVTINGGTLPYSYLWDNAATINAINNLTIGNYSVTVTDANLCSITSIISITQPPLLSVTTDSINVTCFNANNGQLNAIGNGGINPLTYTWSPGNYSGANITGVSPGVYTVTVRDANNCTATDAITVLEPLLLTASITKTDANCGQNNGVLNVSPSGGNSTYSYSWSNAATSATISSLTPIGYTVTVTDNKGCSATSSATITEPDAITLNLTSTNVICNGADNGTATATVTGGSLSYNYTWAASTETTATRNSLAPGTYTVTVSDQNNAFCVLTATTTITQPTALIIVNPTTTNLSCNGSNNGSINLTVSGGITPYQYSWSNSQTTNNLSGLSQGIYTLTVTDGNLCTLTTSLTITEPAVLTVATTKKDITCNGYNNGEAYALANGGTAPYNYVWNTNTINDTIKSLVGNTYTLTVTDTKGCTATNTITIIDPPGMALTVQKTNTACGTANGTAKVTVVGGNLPLTYLWSNGSTSANLVGLAKGKFYLTVTDNTGCMKIDSAIVTEPNGIKVQFTPTNIVCNGDNNGQIVVSATGGGTAFYNYTWIPSGSNTTTISNLTPGKYKVLVKSATNAACSALDSVTITQPLVLTAAPISSKNITCNGLNNGEASTNPTGGTAPYTYLWTNNSTNDTIKNLSPITYTVSVTDNKGCTTTASVAITQPTPLTIAPTVTQATCGNNNGSVTANAGGGTSPYAYSWSPIFSTTGSINNVGQGKYYVTVFDANSCSKVDSANVTYSNGITASFTTKAPLCYGDANGEVSVTANGGNGNFVYVWQPSGNTNPNLFNMSAGTYTVTITDVNVGSCFKIDSIKLTQPGLLTGTVSAAKASCTGTNDYIANASISGGTTPYTYEWSGTGIAGNITTLTNTLTNLGPGSFGLYVRDANGCDTTLRFDIDAKAPPNPLVRITNAKCNLDNGKIIVPIVNGAEPFTYTWSPTITNSTLKSYVGGNDTIFTTNVAPGIYTITVTDAYSCTGTKVATVTNQFAAPTIGTNNTPVTCFKGNDGTLTASTSGGSQPYSYSWSIAGVTSQNVNGQTAGTYTVTVTDLQSCTATSTTTIPQPDSIQISKTVVNATCFSANTGSITITTTTGGTPNYTYNWPTSANTGATESNLIAGLYTVTISDSKNCTQTDTIRVTEPPQLKLKSIIINNASCFGGADGSIKVRVADGTPNYTFNWTAPISSTDSIAGGLSQGAYTVTVLDANGCSLSTDALITQPSNFAAVVNQKNISCFGGNDGYVKVNITGSNKPYLYNWNPTGEITDSIGDLTQGIYTLDVVDSLGCAFSEIITITQPPIIATSINKVDVTCFGATNATAEANAVGGTRPFTFAWSNNPTITSSDSVVTGLKAGIYSVYIVDANGCKDTSNITILQPDSVKFDAQKTDLNCFKDSTGTITINVQGGTPTYTYNWSNNETTKDLVNLKSGTYILTVTDFKNCIYIDTVKILQPTPVIANTSQVDVLCFGKNTGSATLTPTGGTPGYNYSWSNGFTTDNISNITSGRYKYTITDSKGCALQDSISINEAQPVVLNTAGLSTKCFNSCDGQAVVIPSNGISPYTFSWSSGGTNPSISNICTGIYTIEVKDANGCIATSNVFVPEPTPLVLIPSSATAHCNKADGSATIDASGATAPYTYTWSIAGQIDSTIQNQTAGDYTVTVTDLNNCSLTTSITIGNADAPLASITSFTNTICSNACAGKAVSTVTGGTGAYTYSWNTNPAQLTADAQNLCIGDYVLSVTDQFGCGDTANVKIEAPTFDINLATLDTIICFGQTASLNAAATGGLPNYNFNWMPGNLNGNNVIVSPTTNQSYTVMVTDANGCQFGPDSILVKVRDPLVVTAIAAPPAACPNTPTTITVTATGGTGIYTFTWQPNNYVGTSIVIAPSSTTTYTITGFDGCTVPNDTATITVFVYPDPVPNFTSLDTVLCINTCIDFTDLSTVGAGSFINQWEWNFGDGQKSSEQNPTHCYELLGQYNVSLKVTTDKGCNKFITKQNFVDVIGIPTAAFNMSSNYIGSKDATVKFTDKSIDAVSWEWNFGDNSYNDSINNTQNPKHTFQDTGTYTIRLIVKNAQGCTDTTTKELRVYPEWTFFIPNAFSPNGDGINDFFNGKGTFIKKYKMMIFDRWGDLIYVTESLTESWDGKANYGDEMAQQDVYVWKVALTDVFDVEHKLIGHVTLVK